jgi:hypothetical protein
MSRFVNSQSSDNETLKVNVRHFSFDLIVFKLLNDAFLLNLLLLQCDQISLVTKMFFFI